MLHFRQSGHSIIAFTVEDDPKPRIRVAKVCGAEASALSGRVLVDIQTTNVARQLLLFPYQNAKDIHTSAMLAAGSQRELIVECL